MLQKNRLDPYWRIQERVFLPGMMGVVAFIPLLWLSSSVLAFPLVVVFLLSLGWMLVRVWRYQPSSEENVVLIRNFQVKCTLGMSTGVFFGTPAASFLFFSTASPLVDFSCLSLAFLTLFGSVLLDWQARRLTRSEASRLSGSKEKAL